MNSALFGPIDQATEGRPFHIAFLCLAQNCEKTVRVFLSYLARLNCAGLRCFAIVGENGSIDSTREVLSSAAGLPLYLVDTSVMSGAPNRLSRMAIGRQLLLDTASALTIKADYICVADLDNVMAVPPEPDAVITAIQRLASDQQIFAVGATSRPVYYDLFSMMSSAYYNPKLPQEIRDSKQNPKRYFDLHQNHIYYQQYALTGIEPIVCSSSFNGFCIYRGNEYFQGTYRDTQESAVCEHITFNRSLESITGKHMLVVPELVLRTPSDHAPSGFVEFWWRKLSTAFRRRVVHKAKAAMRSWLSTGMGPFPYANALEEDSEE
jgi:hypothetical protein